MVFPEIQYVQTFFIEFTTIILPPLPFCLPAVTHNSKLHFCSCLNVFFTPVFVTVVPVGTCLTCTLRATQHGSASTLSTSGSCSWCLTAEMSSSADREVSYCAVSSPHTAKSLFLAFLKRMSCEPEGRWGSGEPAASLSLRSPLLHHPPLPVPGPRVYFSMNVWIRWKQGSVGFGFGFQRLTCYSTHELSYSVAHGVTDGLEQLTPIKLFLF